MKTELVTTLKRRATEFLPVFVSLFGKQRGKRFLFDSDALEKLIEINHGLRENSDFSFDF